MGIYVKSNGALAPAATTKGLKGDQGIQGIQGVKGDPGGWVTSGMAPANLNTATTPGLYLMTFAAASAAGSNTPVALEGHVEVVKYGTSYTYQRYSVANVNNNYAYTRLSSDNGATWTAWALLGSKPVTDHVAAADPHTQYARKGATNTFSSAQRIETAGGGLNVRRTNGTADAREWATYTETDGNFYLAPVSDAGLGNGTSFAFHRDGTLRQGVTRDAVGTGSPEGVVAASVGSRYRDIAATNGAVEWIKVSGTSNTGWRVSSGDTGSRTITSSLTAGAALSSGGAVVIRRMGDTVHLMFNMVKSADATTTGRNVLVIPSGFRPVSAVYVRSYQNVNAYAASSDVYFGSLFANAGTPADYITFTYLTSEAWPTTLPGTA